MIEVADETAAPAAPVETPEEANKRRARERRARLKAEAAGKGRIDASIQTAAMVLSILDGLAMSMIGPDAGMTESERNMIQVPLGKMFDRMSPEVQEAVDKWVDPLTLVFGLAAWGTRVWRQEADKAEKAAAATSHLPTSSVTRRIDEYAGRETPMSDNGKDGMPTMSPPADVVEEIGGDL